MIKFCLIVVTFSEEQDSMEERSDHHATEDCEDVERCQEVQTQVSTTKGVGEG